MAAPLSFLLIHCYVQFVLSPAFILYTLITGKTNAFFLTNHICNFMNIHFVKTEDSPDIFPGIIHLCNHRSWADFFIDQAMCGGDAYLSRMMVWLGTPISSLWAWLSHSTWYFNRRSGIDRDLFGEYIEKQWSMRQMFGLIAYPEGTRNQKDEPLRLKSGVLQYAYEYNHPVQAVITAGKDNVINEKRMHVQRGAFCVTAISRCIDPQDFDTLETFVDTVRKTFSKTWHKAYTTKPEDGILCRLPLTQTKPEFLPVPLKSRLFLIRLAVVLFLVYLYCTYYHVGESDM